MNHNQPPEHPAQREQDSYDWDLPISLADTEALGRRLDTASDTDTIINNQDAQTIAVCLSDRLESGLHSAIRQLGEIGSINAQALRAECLAAHGSGELPPGLRRWAAWLVTYAAHAVPPQYGGVAMPTNGDALDVYLRLPDIETEEDTLLAEFGHTYCGSYVDIDAVLDGITDVLEWEKKIRAAARELGCEEFVSVDREAIAWHVHDGWDVIPSHGRLHAFFR
jgi:hypothetical protein